MTDQTKKSFFGRLIASILSIFKSGWEDFMRGLWKKIPQELKDELIPIVQIMERIKAYADSPVVDLVTFAIPGTLDDKIVAAARKILTSVLAELNLDTKPVSQFTKIDKQSLATRLTEEITELPFDQASTTIKTAYWNVVKLGA